MNEESPKFKKFVEKYGKLFKSVQSFGTSRIKVKLDKQEYLFTYEQAIELAERLKG